jgi:hypothetical protein
LIRTQGACEFGDFPACLCRFGCLGEACPSCRIVPRRLLKLPNSEQLGNLMLLGANGCDDLEELKKAKDQR